MLFLFIRRIGSLKPYHVWRTALIAIAASAVMALPLMGVLRLLRDIVPSGSLGYLIRIVVASGVGGAIYLLILALYACAGYCSGW